MSIGFEGGPLSADEDRDLRALDANLAAQDSDVLFRNSETAELRRQPGPGVSDQGRCRGFFGERENDFAVGLQFGAEPG